MNQYKLQMVSSTTNYDQNWIFAKMNRYNIKLALSLCLEKQCEQNDWCLYGLHISLKRLNFKRKPNWALIKKTK